MISSALPLLRLPRAPLALRVARSMVQYNTGGGFQDYVAADRHDPIDGKGATAVIFGGFGFNERQVRSPARRERARARKKGGREGGGRAAEGAKDRRARR